MLIWATGVLHPNRALPTGASSAITRPAGVDLVQNPGHNRDRDDGLLTGSGPCHHLRQHLRCPEKSPRRADDSTSAFLSVDADAECLQPNAGLHGQRIHPANVLRAGLAEMVGTFFLIFTGTATAGAAALGKSTAGTPPDWCSWLWLGRSGRSPART